MKNPNKIKVALVIPPIVGHLTRGTGTYFNNLYDYLKKDDRIEVDLITLSDPANEYDLIHYPYFDPFFLTMPLLGKLGKKPHLVTVHDLIPLKYPDKFPAGFRGIFKWNIQKSSLNRASHIITDSNASKKGIIKYALIKENKISIIYLGVDPDFKIIDDQRILNKTVLKFNLPEKFLLHVGDVNYNKNIPGILKAFSILKDKFVDHNLVLVGQGFIDPTSQLDEILSLAGKLGLTGRIKRLAGLDLSDLVCLYNLAQIYLQPSFDEGFGLPVIEAFACHTPVISSNKGSLPEIASQAALFTDPEDFKSIAESIDKLLTDDILRKKLIEKGISQAKKYSWKKTSDDTVRLYQKTLGLKEYQN